MIANYICLDGSYFNSEEKVLTHKNRSFCYGDGLFETMRCLGTEPLFYEKHWNRLTAGMKLLKMHHGDQFSKAILKLYIEKLLNKNRIFKGARIRLSVFRKEGGFYTPATDTVSWLIESSTLENEHYKLNSKGLYIDIFDGVHKQVNQLSNLKSSNALPYVLAGIFKREENLEDCLILNQFGRVCEALHSNLFIFINDTLLTPPLEEGCIAGTMRNTIIALARELGYTVIEKGILEKNLLDAEEIFTTNAIHGIQWVGAYKDKRYFNFVAKKLLVALNKQVHSV